MTIWEQIKQWAGLKSPASVKPGASPLREGLEAGQRAKWAEDYPHALEQLGQAMQFARDEHDTGAAAVILHILAEVYIRLYRWADADQLLQTAYQRALETHHKMQAAYTLCAMGTLAQAQGDWDSARQHYERALDVAREGRVIGAEGRAMGFLADTYLREGNASYAVHLLRDALTKLNMTGDVELSSYFVGRLGEALIATGHEGEGRQLLERALRLARQIGYRLYERQWNTLIGKRALSEGQYNDAYAHFVRVLTLSEGRPPTPETIDVLCQLSKVCLSLHQTREALEHAQTAVRMSEELADARLLAQSKGALGMVLLADKQTAEAVPNLEAAAASSSDSFLGEVERLRALAAAYAENGEVERAISTYRQAAEQAQASGAKLELAQSRRDLGLLYVKQYKMADAIREWTAALSVYEAENQPSQVARLLCDIAAARKFLGQGQRAMKDYEQALMLLSSAGDDWETRGLVLSNAANAYVDRGDIESAESFFNESIAIARRLGNEAAEATRRGNYGWFLLAIGRPQQAIAALEYALRQSQSLRLHLPSAIQTDNLGLAFDQLGNYSQALEYHQRALDRVRPLQESHWENLFQINQAATLITLGRAAEAKPLLETALSYGRTSEDAEVAIRALIGLARVLLSWGKPDEAAALADEAVTLARRADMRRLLAEALSVSSQQQAAQGHTEKAAECWQEALKLFTMLNSPEARLSPAWLNGSS